MPINSQQSAFLNNKIEHSTSLSVEYLLTEIDDFGVNVGTLSETKFFWLVTCHTVTNND